MILVSGSASAAGNVEIESVMLSKTTGTEEYDLTNAGHFESSNSGYSPSVFWKYDAYPNTAVSIVDSGISAFGRVLCVNTSFTDERTVSQKIYQSTDEMKNSFLYDQSHLNPHNDPICLKVSGWAKGTGQSYADGSMFDIALRITYLELSGQTGTKDYSVDFDRGCNDWQFVSGVIETEPNDRMIDSIEVVLRYKGHQGIGYFDGISVNVNSESASVYEYGSPKGYLSKAANGSKVVAYDYETSDGNKVIKTVNTGKRTITEYTYDGSKRLSSEIVSKYTGIFNPNTGTFSNNNTITQLSETVYTYNTYGLVTQIVSEDLLTAGNPKTKVSYTYITPTLSTDTSWHIFGALETETDALGNETTYFYGTGSDTGRLKAVIYPNGKGTCYTYDRMGNITEVLPATVSGSSYSASYGGADVSYGYDPATKRLSSITAGPGASSSTTYYFTYDNFGNSTQTKAGTRTLASYSYNSENGKLNKLVYGNGLEVQYIYDALDRISEIKHRNGSSGSFTTAYTYTYTSAGYLYSVTDHVNGGETTVYEYDSGGRVISSYVTSSANEILSASTVFYDDGSRVRSLFDHFSYNAGSALCEASDYYSYFYSQTTGNLSKLSYRGTGISGEVSPVYDNLGRTKSRTLEYDISNSDAFYNKITYGYASNGTYTSGRVSSYGSVIGTNSSNILSGTTRTYLYDSNGNITSVSGAEYASYEYDSLGQLTRENNYALNKTYVYSYDGCGNITSKTVYAYTVGSLSGLTPQQTITYSYADSTWRDLLTNYNGTTISYDAIGNPTSMGSMYLTWKGRQLTGGIIGPGNLSFTYNADGIRTSKQYYNGIYSDLRTVRHEYTLSGTLFMISRWLSNPGQLSARELAHLVYDYSIKDARTRSK